VACSSSSLTYICSWAFLGGNRVGSCDLGSRFMLEKDVLVHQPGSAQASEFFRVNPGRYMYWDWLLFDEPPIVGCLLLNKYQVTIEWQTAWIIIEDGICTVRMNRILQMAILSRSVLFFLSITYVSQTINKRLIFGWG
jgi:hypothetical protein